MLAEPTPITKRREADAIYLEDGWVACVCSYRFGFQIRGTSADARVKCPNRSCGRWVRMHRASEAVSRRI